MPNCSRAQIRLQTLHVQKTVDTGGSSEWELDFIVAGQGAHHRFEGLHNGSLESIAKEFAVDVIGDNLVIGVSGIETDSLFSGDEILPTCEARITPADNWENGQTFTKVSSHDEDFSYSITFDIRCITPNGSVALTAGDGSNLREDYPKTTFQSGWHWCNKCQGMWFSGFNESRRLNSNCPAGGCHTRRGSGNYALIHNTPEIYGRQAGWRWCKKCEGFFFGRNHPSQSGVCPQGGKHDSTGSGLYNLVHNMRSDTGQHGWRWCKKCEGLFFTGHSSGICPAGNGHDHSASGRYSVIYY